MPTYVYKFVETGETIEVQQSFQDDTLTEYVHPDSGATLAVKKVFQPVGVTFKGSGFFKNDNRGKTSSTTPPAANGSSDSAGGSTSDAGSSSSSSSESNGSSGSSSKESSGGSTKTESASSTSTSSSTSSD